MPVRQALPFAALTGLLALLAVLAPTTPAHAHDSLLGSRPAAGTVVSTPPNAVELLFDAGLAPYAPTVLVTSPSGAAVQSGPAQVAGTKVTQPLAALREPGEYVVAYRVVSGDGHPVTGTFSFFYGTGPSATPSEGSTSGSSGPGATAVIIGLAVLAAGAVVVGALVARRRQPARPPS